MTVHQPDLSTNVSAAQQMIFDQGHEVGIHAQSLFPGGTLIDAPYYDSKLSLGQTQAAIASGAINIYEATLEHEGVLVKVDILNRKTAKTPWEIVEVKSSTQIKDVHLQDAAIQFWVLRNAGLKVQSASILHINNQCRFPDLSNLFTTVSVTKEVQALQKEIPEALNRFKRLLDSKTAPDKEIGPHCDDPYECAFKDHCWSKKKIPEISIFDIPRLSSKQKWELYADGKTALASLDLSKFNATQRRMIEATVSKKRFVDVTGIKRELQAWKYPLSFLDFETIAFAIPRYVGTRPYQQLPFQFSCHIQESENSELKHCEYLHVENSDPREAIANSLVKMIPTTGSVVAYNMGFEKQVLLALAEQFPKHKIALKKIAERLVDPLSIFRSHVYDPKFSGGFSIKDVAPALLGKNASYEGMLVGDGSAAQVAFLELIHAEAQDSKKKTLEQSLRAYCQKDTLGMAQLVEWLQEQID